LLAVTTDFLWSMAVSRISRATVVPPTRLAVLALADNQTPIICNGFKDDEYIEMVMLARKIGRHIIPVVEKYTELEMIAEHAGASACGRRSGCG
jgi:arginine decarboxylase-like protein